MYIKNAFTGTSVKTENFKMFTTGVENKAIFQSYGRRLEVDLKDNTIKGLDIKFASTNEAIRTANLINRIVSAFPDSNK